MLAVNRGISSLKGIEHFPNLMGINCSYNGLTELDISGNPQLVLIDCSYNKLSKLDISGNPRLANLNCESNDISELDISANRYLFELYCAMNNIVELDTSGTRYLRILDCNNNGIKSLDLSGSPALIGLWCSSNDLASLNITGCTALDTIYCYDNKLTALDLSGSPALTDLRCYSNDLSSLNITGCVSLDTLYCQNNSITALDTSGFSVLRLLNCSNNSIKALDLSGSPALFDLLCYSNELTSLNVTGCANLDRLTCSNNNLSELDVSGLNLLRILDCHNNSITSLNLSGKSALVYLWCYNNNLSSLNITGCSSLDVLECYNNNIAELDVSTSPLLRSFNCYNNRITSLNFSGNTSLTDFECSNNNLSSLNVTSCASLRKIYCYNNSLTSLNLSGKEALTEILCYSNDLSSLSVNGCTYLNTLRCDNNKLSALDVSSCAALRIFACDSNRLEALDVSGCTALEVLDCDTNQLSALDVSRCTLLNILDCEHNKLTALDASKCTALQMLYCEDNQLTSLNVSGCIILQVLDCFKNKLTALDVSRCTALEILNCSANRLTRLGVRNCRNLSVLYCYSNLLTELDLRNNTNLKALDCNFNLLTALDLRNNTALELLACNSNDIPALDLSRNYALTALSCDNALETLHIVPSGRSDYPYSMSLSEYVGSSISRVKSVKAYDSNGREIALIFGETVLFASRPSRVVYEYDTGSALGAMKMTLSVPTLHMYYPRGGSFWVANITLDSGLINAVTDAFPGIAASDVNTFHSIITSETWTLSSNDAYEIGGEILFSLPEAMAASDGAYVLMCVFESGTSSKDEIFAYDLTSSGAEYVFLDEGYHAVDYVPESRQAYLAVKLPAGKVNRSVVAMNASMSSVSDVGVSSSSGGCSSGLGLLALCAVAGFFARRKKTLLLAFGLVMLAAGISFADVSPSDYVLPIPFEDYTPAGKCRTDFTFTPELAEKVAANWPNRTRTGENITSRDVHSFADISLGDWNFTPDVGRTLSDIGAYGAALLPLTQNGTGNGVYVVLCEFSNDVKPGELLSGVVLSIDLETRTRTGTYVIEQREITSKDFSTGNEIFLDENMNRIYTVPNSRKAYAAISLASNNNSGLITVVRGRYVTEDDPLSRIHPALAQMIADYYGIEVSELKYLTQNGLGAPREATDAMKQYIADDNREIMLNMPTVSIDEGYKAAYFVYTLPDNVWQEVKGKSINDYPVYALNDDGVSESGQVKSSFLLNGVVSLWELNGGRLDSFGVKEFIIAGLLSASKPFSFYLAKILLMLLLGGCSSGIYTAGIIAGLVFAFVLLKMKIHRKN